MTTTRDPLAVLRLAAGHLRPTLATEEYVAITEAIAQVEALSLSHAKLLAAIQANADPVYEPPSDTRLVTEAMMAQAPFTPGQDSEGGDGR